MGWVYVALGWVTFITGWVSLIFIFWRILKKPPPFNSVLKRESIHVKKKFVSNFLFIDFLNLKVMLRNAIIIFVLQYFELYDQIW